MPVVFEFGGANPYATRDAKDKISPSIMLICLEQRRVAGKKFRLTYGLEVKDDLTYEEAARALGLALLHHLSCEGVLDPPPGEPNGNYV